MAGGPAVSILIPVYNREKLIVPCVQSALGQTFADLEVVVVDNCSTDDTYNVCRKLAESDTRLRVYRNESNIGPVRNWMRCAELARGRLGRILFSDDLMLPAALEKSVPYLDDPEVGFVVSAATIGPEPDNAILYYTWRNQDGKAASVRYLRTMMAEQSELPVSPGSTLFRLADIRRHLRLDIAAPGQPDFAGHGAGPDLLLSLLTAAAYPAIVHLREPLTFFRNHAGSITSEKRESVMRAYAQVRMWFAARQPEPWWREYAFGVGWLQRMYVRRGWIAPSGLRSELVLPADPQPHAGASLWQALKGWALPQLTGMLGKLMQ